jgi:hypothetical protein
MKNHEKFFDNHVHVSKNKSITYLKLSSINLDHIKDINEVRAGFRAQTFGQLLKNGLIKSTDVSISMFFGERFRLIYSGKFGFYDNV